MVPRGVIPGPTEIDSGFVKNEIRLYHQTILHFHYKLLKQLRSCLVPENKGGGGGGLLFLVHVEVKKPVFLSALYGQGDGGTFLDHQRIMMTSPKT